MTSQLISMSSSEIKGLQTTFSLSFFGAYKDSIVELVPGYLESSSSSESSESSSSLSSKSSLSTFRLRSTSSSISSLSSGNSSSSSVSSLNSSSSTSTTSDPCLEDEKFNGPLQVFSDAAGQCAPSGENDEWCIEGPEGNYPVWPGYPYNSWYSDASVCEWGYPCPSNEEVPEYIIRNTHGTWYLNAWAFNPHSTEGGEYVEIASFSGSSDSGPYGWGTHLGFEDTSYYVIATISPCLGILISDSGMGPFSADGMYTQISWDSQNKTPIFSNTYGWKISFIGGINCGGEWFLIGPGEITYAKWATGNLTTPPSGIVSEAYLGLSEDTNAQNSWSNCP